MQGIPIGPITRGLMDGVADAERQAATYRDGVNVRGIDPRTGKAVWGAQRAGLSAFGDAPGDGYPTLLMTTFRQRRAREWAALTVTEQPDVVPQQVDFDWRTSLESASVACAEGPDGQGYFLLDTGMVQILTLSGKITATIESTVPYGYEVVDDLIIADDGSVIFACFTRQDLEFAPKGLVRRYAREEDGRWLQSWESEFEDPVVAIGYNNGSLFVVSEPVATAQGTVQDGKLARIGAPLVGPEVLWSREGLPRPVVDLKVNGNGEAFISAPSNPRRGYQNQGFGETSVDWIPSMDPEWQTDGWAWFDAFHVNDSTTGVPDETTVERLRDRRYDEQEFYTPDETSPERTLKKAEAVFPIAPEFSQAAFGGVGGVTFDGNSALGTNYTIESGKDNAFTILPNGPQEEGSAEAPTDTRSFVAAFVVQVLPDQMPLDAYLSNRGLWNQPAAVGDEAPISYATQATNNQVWSKATPPETLATIQGDIGLDEFGAPTSTNASVIVYEVKQVNNGSNEQVTIDMYVDGRLVGQQTAAISGDDVTIDNAGPFAYAPTADGATPPLYASSELPGPVSSWGGYRVNYNNLSLGIRPAASGNSTPAKTRNNVYLNNDSNASNVAFGCRYDSRASTAGPFTNRSATTGLRRDVTSRVGKNGLALYTIDMGEDVLMDTFSFEYYYTGEGRGFNQVHVRVTPHGGDVDGDDSIEVAVTLDLEENGPGEWHREVVTITTDPIEPNEPSEGAPPVLARYVQVTTFNEPFAGISSKNMRMRQFRVLNQVVSPPLSTVAPRTYAHNFGEFISAYRQTSSMTAYRQRLEGYLAHKFGLQGQLTQTAGGNQHPYYDLPPAGVGNTKREDSGKINYALRSPFPILAKFAGDGEVMSAFTGAGVGLGCALHADQVFTAGETVAQSAVMTADLAMIRRIKDEGRKFTLETRVLAGANEELQRARVPLQLGPTQQLYAALSTRRVGSADIAHTLRMFDGDPLAQQWSFSTQQRVRDLATAGLQVNETARLGASGSEYVLAAFSSQRDSSGTNPSAEARKITLMGLRDTGQVSGRDAEHLAVMSSGAIKRKTAQDSWEQIGAPGSLVGRSIGFATLYGNTFIADGLDYRVYNHATGALRSFADSVKGGFPPRCELVAAYSGRLVMARGDNAFTVYQSRYGDPFDFDYGPEVQSISQAIAGTVASQGKPPEPITALIPFRDSRLYIGTTESLFVQTGDLADGGRLDQLDKSQGVAPGYAWCESTSGIYYFSARGGVNFLNAQSQISVISYGSVQRRLEEIDITKSSIKLCYNWIDKTVHVFVLANNVGSDVEHFVFDEALGAWHKDSFGSGFENAVTTAATQHGDSPEDRSLLIAFGDGRVRRWDQYAQDDDGKPIQSYAMVGPLVSGQEGIETRIQGLYAQLATDQGPVEVAIRASNSADAPGPPGTFARLEPGRGLGVGVNASAPALYVDVRGIGSAWAVHELRGEISVQSDVRSTS